MKTSMQYAMEDAIKVKAEKLAKQRKVVFEGLASAFRAMGAAFSSMVEVVVEAVKAFVELLIPKSRPAYPGAIGFERRGLRTPYSRSAWSSQLPV
jgi:hypothetical protein